MAIKIIDKRVREEILDHDGNRIGEISFNPDDTAIYTRFIKAIERIMGAKKQIDSVGLDSAPGELESMDDFEQASQYFNQINQTIKTTDEAVDAIAAEFDAIFGQGVCACFLQGSHDLELLNPLIDGVAPFFKESRGKHTAKYGRTSAKSVMK